MPISEFPENHRAEYREGLLNVLVAIRNHRGAENTHNEFIARAAELETWMARTFGESGASRLPDEEEAAITAAYRSSGRPLTINQILGMAVQRLDRLEDESIDALRITIDAVILPTRGTPPSVGSNAGGFESPHFPSRLRHLITLLQSHKIFTDDIAIVNGKVTKDMMRQKPYVLVEIPRLHRQVLVCDQVGEATFISSDMLSRKTFTKLSKEELLEQYPKTQSIVHRNDEQWEHDVWKALVNDRDNIVIGPKIDIHDQEAVRTEIMERYTPAQWVAMPVTERQEFKLGKRGLVAIFSVFGIKGIRDNDLSRFRLGAYIWGADEPIIAEALAEEMMTQEEIRNKIIADYTPQQWAAMPIRERRDLKIGKRGALTLCRLFGVEEHPYTPGLGWLQLGAAIWGADDKTIAQAIADEKMTRAEIAKQIIATWTPIRWITMSPAEARSFVIAGKSLIQLGTMYDIEGNARDQKLSRLLLGAAIWGDGEPTIAPAIVNEKMTKEDIAKQIIATWTPIRWISMSHDEVRNFEVAGRSLGLLLGKIYGIAGNPRDNRLSRLLLGAAIWGTDEPIITSAIEKEHARNQSESTT